MNWDDGYIYGVKRFEGRTAGICPLTFGRARIVVYRDRDILEPGW